MFEDFNKLDGKYKHVLVNLYGLDNAIMILTQGWVIDPIDLIDRAIRSKLITLDQVNEDLIKGAIYSAEEVKEDYLDSGEGFGSSDGTFAMKSMLDNAGYKTGWINNRLAIIK